MLMDRLCACVLEGDGDGALVEAELLLSEGVSARDLLGVLAEELAELGRRFEDYRAFLPDLILAGDAFAQVMDRLEGRLEPGGDASAYTAVVGTVQGDFHDIGKNLLVVALRIGGFRVVDLGTDVAPETFLAAAREHRADVVGLSTLLSSTLVFQADFIRLLEESGDRQEYLVSIGGASTSGEWSREIGADVWGPNVFESVERIRLALERRDAVGRGRTSERGPNA